LVYSFDSELGIYTMYVTCSIPSQVISNQRLPSLFDTQHLSDRAEVVGQETV